MLVKYFLLLPLGSLSVFMQQYSNVHQKNNSEYVKNWLYPKGNIYDPPSTWSGWCEHGQTQSPVRLTFCQSREFHFRRLLLSNYNIPYFFFSLYNNGQGVAIAVPQFLDITISGGPLDDVYVLENIHWHWNKSEHATSDPDLILETHLVHRKKEYVNVREAIEHKDGLVILAILHKQATKSSKYLKKVLENVARIEYPGDYAEITQQMAVDELLPSDFERYFTYFGSLTTPPCSEAVTWIVFVDYLNASLNDIERFRQAKLADGSILMQNFRPLKPLNDRIVWLNKPEQ